MISEIEPENPKKRKMSEPIKPIHQSIPTKKTKLF